MAAAKPRSLFPHMLWMIFALFIGILVYVYIEAKKANPVILDEKGNVRVTGYGRNK